MVLKSNGQRLVEADGHRFDVLTTEPKGNGPERDLYFNVDLPQQALRKSLAKVFEAPERRFESLLATARKDPTKADWKALRSAFAQTGGYKPFNPEWPEEIRAIARDLEAGRLKEVEAALVKVLERERFMRVEAHSLAAVLYEKLGQSAKAKEHTEFFQGISGAVFAPDRGTDFPTAFEILFPDEEFLFLGLEHVNVEKQEQVERDGRLYDVVTAKAVGNEPGRKYYFAIDLPSKAMQKAAQKAIELKIKKPADRD